MPSLLSSLLTLSACLRPIIALGPWQHFQTEPTFRTSIFNITINTAPDLLEPGYIWLTPYVSDFKVGSFGPQIYTTDGELIWNGNDSAYIRAMDAHVCDYLGEKGTHICMNDAAPTEQGGHSAGLIRFFDNTYTQVGTDYGAVGGLRAPDIHELNTPASDDGYSFLQDVFEVRGMDLEAFRGPRDGYVLDGCFQDVDMRTKEVKFQWCALDHLDIWDTYLYLHGVHSDNNSLPIAGNGSFEQPWDFIHMNAVGKNMEGDYIVSGRHLDQVLKIAGNDNNLGKAPGEIIWRLGGKNSDFELDDFLFSRQHSVRFISTGRSKTVISLFNNNYDGWAHRKIQSYSDGQLIELDNTTMVARRIRSYPMPSGKMAYSQGSMQTLANGNVFMGWGNLAYVSEHTNDGEPIYYAHFSGEVESFRAWKFPWVGRPRTPPKLLAYALDAASPLYAYASWNGATEVAAWAFYTSNATARGPWRPAGTMRKAGFETFANMTELAPYSDLEAGGRRPVVPFSPYMYAEALDAAGEVIGTSAVVETFIPREPVRYACGETLCASQWFSYAPDRSRAREVPRSHAAGIWALLCLLCAVELVYWVMAEYGWELILPTPRSGRRTGRLAVAWSPVHVEKRGEMSEKWGLRPDVKRLMSGPAPLLVTVGGRTGTGFPMRVSGYEV